MVTVTACPVCGGPVEQRGGPGARRTYCGVVCRRRAEFAVRRIDRIQADIDHFEVRRGELERERPDRYLEARVRDIERAIAVRQERIRAIAAEVGLAEVVAR